MQKALIIGSNSFSGATFISYLLNKGMEVVGVSRSPEKQTVFLPYHWINEKQFRFYQIDMNYDLEKLMTILNQFKPSMIFNFSAQSMVAQSWDHPEHWMQTNVVSMSKFLNYLKNIDFLDKYVHISTPEVYGSCSGAIQENNNYNPSTPYAVSRAAADMLLKTYFDAYQFPVVITRAANVYGPGQQLYRIIPRTILFIKMGKKLQLHGGGLSERSFIHMNDVCDATWKIAQNGIVGETYHIATNKSITIKNLVQMICHQMDANFDDAIQMSEDRLGKDAAYLLDSRKLRNALAWSDNTLLEDGIKALVAWMEDNFDVLKTQSLDYHHKV